MEILRKILPLWIKVFILEHRYMFKELRKHHKKYLKKILEENKRKSLSIDNEKKWIKKLNRLTYSYPELIEVGEAFATSEISILQNREIYASDIIAICVEKNDIIKLKKFITYHRLIGIDKFVILDNNSTDGSVEWLLEQKDVILLQTKTSYTSFRRVGWINRIIAYYGDNRWYFVADSDELLVYNDCENKKIQEVIEHYTRLNINRARAVMVDMYAKPEYYISGNTENYFNECIYFDTNTYSLNKKEYFNEVMGGPRERMFNFSPWLTKYPLFYFRKSDIFCRSHFLYPYKENLKSDCNLVLKHYKFLPGELEKYKKIAEAGNYYNGSKQYKEYVKVMKNNSNLNFMCECTAKYENSMSLEKINIYKKINWKGK